MTTLYDSTDWRTIDEHARDTLSTGWREITRLCHCEVPL